MDQAEFGELDPEIIAWVVADVAKIRGWYGLQVQDIEDHTQHILWELHLKLRSARQKGAIQNPRAFVRWFVKMRIVDVLRERLSKKGTRLRRMERLMPELYQQDRRPGAPSDQIHAPKQPGNMMHAELAVEVAEVIERLPKKLQRLCALLRHHSKSHAARQMNTSRSKIDRLVEKLRAAFIAAGFTEFALRHRKAAKNADEPEPDRGKQESIGRMLETWPLPHTEGPKTHRAKIIALNRQPVAPSQTSGTDN